TGRFKERRRGRLGGSRLAAISGVRGSTEHLVRETIGETAMSTESHGRVKRLHAEFRGDEAVEIDILEVMLRMGEVSRSRIEGDTRLVRLALKGRHRVIA